MCSLFLLFHRHSNKILFHGPSNTTSDPGGIVVPHAFDNRFMRQPGYTWIAAKANTSVICPLIFYLFPHLLLSI